ncbi:ABC transporter ATP-binding protein [Conexibacter woesei]|uniref:ABC transporter ATP-binding protein n=1 Tax=Conexibacter woesei TaxID=191495 RepID=UPI0003FF22AA|nr:ABC transporter ATP-binding protein [Conexibacter woesei]
MSPNLDPPDHGLRLTTSRLLDVWRLQRRLTALALLYALMYSALSLAIPLLIARTIDDSILHDERPLAPQLAIVAVLAAVRSTVNFLRRYATARVGVGVEASMRELLYGAYLRFPRAFYDLHPTGQVVSRATNDLYPVRYFIGWGMVQGAQSIMMILGTAVVLGVTNLKLAALSAIPLPLIGLVAWRFAHLVTPISRDVQARKGDVTESADEAVVGIEMVQAFGREDDVQDRFAQRADAVRTEVLRQARVESHHLPGLFYLPSASVAVVLLVGGRAVIHGTLTYGEFALFIQLLLQLVWPLESTGWIINLGQRALASAGRSFAWLDEVPVLPERPDPARMAEGDTGVELRGVRFAYPGAAEAVLDGVDLTVAPGEVVAVCGATGAGKSTLLGLLPRFYDPDAGAVLLGGHDLRDLALDDVRGAVGVVTQRPILFSETLRDNLLAGRPDADDAALHEACDVAGVTAFLDDLPDRWQTLIGERGVNLSGGQRQRVALARALLTDAPVLVLDDPLSAVDTTTEDRIVTRLRSALEGRAVLLATQRLSTLALADRIVVLDDGVVVESGTQAQLLERGGTFAELFGEDASVAA